MDWLTGWTYRKSITLSRASGAVTNYQMKLLVGESSGASGEDVDCGGKCLSTFADLRYTTSDGSTLLDYWIESITGTTPNQLATVWIEFDSIGTSDTTFYMYYGKADATAVSSGANTFIFFDDFERGNDGDTVGGDWTEAIAHVHISTDQHYGGTRSAKLIGNTGSSFCHMERSLTPSSDISIMARLNNDSVSDTVYGPYHGNGTRRIYMSYAADKKLSYYNSGGTPVYVATLTSSWNLLEVNNINWSTFKYDIILNGIKVANQVEMHTSGYVVNALAFIGSGLSATSHWYIDNTIVRNWRETEPAWGSWGSEVAPPIEITPLALEAITSLGYGDLVEWPKALTVDPMETTTGLSAGLAHALPAPALEAAANLVVTAISYGFFLSPDPLEAAAGLSASLAHSIPAPALGVTAELTAKMMIGLPAALGVTANLDAPGVIVIQSDEYIITYLCYLTPQPGSIYPAITLPMSSFQGRFKSGDPSYLSVVIPGDDYATAISDRDDPNDPPELSLYMVKTFADGNVISEQLMIVDLEDVRTDEGSQNISITLEGHRTTTYSAKAVSLTGASYKSIIDGKTRYRCTPDLYLRPGDTVTVNGDTFTADNISISISVESQTMEVAEA